MATPQQAFSTVSLREDTTFNTVAVKGKSAERVGATAPEIKSTLLKILDLGLESPPKNTSALSCQRDASKNWWPSVKKVFTGSFKSAANRSEGFEIRSEDLKLRENLGDGLRASVFEAELKSDRRRVVVKQLRGSFNPENADKTVADLHTVSTSLRHPNIVDFIGVSLNKATQSVSVVCELMSGGTLEDFFDSQSDQWEQVPFPRVVGWSLQLFEALQFLHDRNEPIIHRDLKPCNLLLSADRSVLKLRDFGVAKTCNLGISLFGSQKQQASAALKTDVSQLTGPSSKGYTGTARYMAPEIDLQKPRGGEYSTAADVYSAALITWFMLEGERPWEEHHGHVALALAKTGRRPPLLAEGGRQYPRAMASLIKHCWAHAPTSRPRASEAVEVLRDMLADAASE